MVGAGGSPRPPGDGPADGNPADGSYFARSTRRKGWQDHARSLAHPVPHRLGDLRGSSGGPGYFVARVAAGDRKRSWVIADSALPVPCFWATLKTELLTGRTFDTRKEAGLAIFEYVEVFYNRKRLHSALGYQSPVDFESKLN